MKIQINDMGNVSNAGKRLYYAESAFIMRDGSVKPAENPTLLMKRTYYIK